MQIKEAPLPEVADGYMGFMRLRITEELAWMRGSPLYALLKPAEDTTEKDYLQSNILEVITCTYIAWLWVLTCSWRVRRIGKRAFHKA